MQRGSSKAKTQNHSRKSGARKDEGSNGDDVLKAPIELTEEQAKMVSGGVDKPPSEQASLNFSKIKF
jgi:hypothetical protein